MTGRPTTARAAVLAELRRDPSRGGKQIAHAAGCTIHTVSRIARQAGIAYGRLKDAPRSVQVSAEQYRWLEQEARAIRATPADVLRGILVDEMDAPVGGNGGSSNG